MRHLVNFYNTNWTSTVTPNHLVCMQRNRQYTPFTHFYIISNDVAYFHYPCQFNAVSEQQCIQILHALSMKRTFLFRRKEFEKTLNNVILMM